MCSKRDIYIASCVETGGIYHYKLQNGKLTLLDVTPMDRPMYMVIEDRKMYIVLRAPFAGSEESGVVVYDMDDEGKLVNPSEMQSTKGVVGCHILVDAGEVYCANYVSGSVIKLPDTLVQHSGQGPHPKRQTGPHAHFVGLTPDKKYICATDLGMDTIFLYNRDMTLRSQVKVPAGHGVRHLAFSSDGQWLFAVNELASTLSVFAYTNGALELKDTCSVLPEDFAGESTASAIRIRNGCIYVSNRGHDSVSQVRFENGKLTLQNVIPCGGKSPRDFDFVDGYMLCTNQDSNTVTVLDSSNHAVLEEVNLDMPICVCAPEELEIVEYDGPGYRPQVDFNGWRVAIANYAPHLELCRLRRLERHMETDEVFVLLEGSVGLLIGEDRKRVDMEKGKVYNVKRAVWHAMYMTEGAKVLIVENTDTGPHNSEFLEF